MQRFLVSAEGGEFDRYGPVMSDGNSFHKWAPKMPICCLDHSETEHRYVIRAPLGLLVMKATLLT